MLKSTAFLLSQMLKLSPKNYQFCNSEHSPPLLRCLSVPTPFYTFAIVNLFIYV